MSLSFVETSPGFMLAGVLGGLVYGTFVQNGQISWKIPALGSAWFWVFTAYTIAQEGIIAVWNNHNHNFWGNQVFFDLLYSVTICWFALLPRAKAVGMPVLPWFMYTCSTGSIGAMHMYARILYLEEREL
jgi:predicted ABC-type sugar transport system permease subunit